MPAHIIDGKLVAAKITEKAHRDCKGIKPEPGLGVVLVGDDQASHLYVSLKQRACAEAGVRMEKFVFPADTPESKVLKVIDGLNKRKDIDGILVQLPLPAGIREARVIEALDPEKDVDGFHPRTIARYLAGQPIIIPGLVGGIMALIASTGADIKGKNALVAANSETFFAPLQKAFEDAGAVPSFLFANDPDLGMATRDADIMVVAAGKPKLIVGGMVKPGAIVIDVGTTRVGKKVVGDVDTDSVKETAGWLTPVPGGVGPVTVAMLLRNICELAKRHRI